MGYDDEHYIELKSGRQIDFITSADVDDHIIMNTTDNVPYISTTGGSNLRLTSSSGLVNITKNLDVGDNISVNIMEIRNKTHFEVNKTLCFKGKSNGDMVISWVC